jgi:hypothetical protein
LIGTKKSVEINIFLICNHLNQSLIIINTLLTDLFTELFLSIDFR